MEDIIKRLTDDDDEQVVTGKIKILNKKSWCSCVDWLLCRWTFRDLWQRQSDEFSGQFDCTDNKSGGLAKRHN